MKFWKKAAALLCAAGLMLPTLPAARADEHVDEVLYQPNPLCGTYLGQNDSGLYEFDVTIPADRENQPKPLVLGPYQSATELSNVTPEDSGKSVVGIRADYFYGIAPGTADVTYFGYLSGETPTPRAIVHVTVLSQADYDAQMDSDSTPHPDGHTHRWSYSWVNPTCQQEGRRTRTCSLCKTTETLDSCGTVAHAYRVSITKKPTATQEGVRTYECNVCGYSYTETLPSSGGGSASNPGGGSSTTNPGGGSTSNPGGGNTSTTPVSDAVYGDGMAKSDRGDPLNLRADGNYELFWVDGIQVWDSDEQKYTSDTRKIKISTYSPDFKETSVKQLDIELPEIGAIHYGEDYNFLVFGQDNFEESREKEVLRIVKYSKDWERLGAASLRDANTIDVIRQHGNFSFAEGGGMLYIHSGHAMFVSSDGLNHQANMTLSIRISDMTITDKNCAISNNSTGYVSHSLADDIIIDKSGNLITLDTGDGSPNGAMLYRYGAKAGEEKFTSKAGTANIFIKWPGERADIRTGGMTCALAETSKGYLSAYLDTKKGAAYDYANDPWSLYLAFTPKDDFSAEATKIRTVVDLPAGAQEMVSHAWLVPTSPEGGYLMWYTTEKTEKGFFGDYTLYYTTYAADGSTGAAKKLDGVPMPYNGPIWTGKEIVWTGEAKTLMGLEFCTLDPGSGKTQTAYASGELKRIKDFSDVREGQWFKPYVDKVTAAKLMTGMSDDLFGPDNNLTVAQALVLAYSTRHYYFDADGETLPESNGPWYMPYYQWCVNKKIITPARFPADSLDRLCTRYEMLEILDKAYWEPDFPQVKEVDSIPDVPAGTVRGDMVYRWYRGGIVTGSSDGLFHGDSNITRAQVSVILCQLEKL